MKKFLKPTKFKLIACMIGGLIWPVCIYILQYLEPEGYIKGPIWAVLFLLSLIVSLIPSFLIHLGLFLSDQLGLVLHNGIDEGFNLMFYAIFISTFNFVFFYLAAFWFEGYKYEKKPQSKIFIKIVLGILLGMLFSFVGMITLAGIGGEDCDVLGESCNCFCCHMFNLRGYESCGLVGALAGLVLGVINGVLIPSIIKKDQ